jgi:hypothetical protein
MFWGDELRYNEVLYGSYPHCHCLLIPISSCIVTRSIQQRRARASLNNLCPFGMSEVLLTEILQWSFLRLNQFFFFFFSFLFNLAHSLANALRPRKIMRIHTDFCEVVIFKEGKNTFANPKELNAHQIVHLAQHWYGPRSALLFLASDECDRNGDGCDEASAHHDFLGSLCSNWAIYRVLCVIFPVISI